MLSVLRNRPKIVRTSYQCQHQIDFFHPVPKPAVIFAHEHGFLPSSPTELYLSPIYCFKSFQERLTNQNMSTEHMFGDFQGVVEEIDLKTQTEGYSMFSSKWLPCVHHAVVLYTKDLHFQVKNTPLKDTNRRGKFKRMVSLLLVHKRKRLGRKLPFDKFNLAFFPEDRLACFGMQLRQRSF